MSAEEIQEDSSPSVEQMVTSPFSCLLPLFLTDPDVISCWSQIESPSLFLESVSGQ